MIAICVTSWMRKDQLERSLTRQRTLRSIGSIFVAESPMAAYAFSFSFALTILYSSEIQHQSKLWDRIALMSLLVLTAAVFLPIIGAQVGGEDYGGHEIFVRQMLASGRLTLPHFFYHALMVGLHQLLPDASLTADSLILIIGFELLLAYLLFWVFGREFGLVGSLEHAAWRTMLILSCMTAAPILLLTFFTHHLGWGYWDYLAITTYHSPTQILLRPLALLLFYLVLRGFGRRTPTSYETGVTAFVVILSTLAKPSFLICLLPAVVAMVVLRLIRSSPSQPSRIQWRHLLIGLAAPAVLVLGWQFWFTYSIGSQSLHPSHISFAPLAFFHWKWPLFRLLLSIAFPLVVLCGYWNSVKSDLAVMFSWMVFFFGASYTYLLAESGNRLIDGNFVWSGQVSLFILFVTSLLFFVRKVRERNRAASYGFTLWLAGFTLFLHIASGIFWYIGQLYREPWWGA